LSHDPSRPHVGARLGDREIVLRIATGSPEVLRVPPALERDVGSRGPISVDAAMPSRGGHPRIRRARLAADLEIGRHRFVSPQAALEGDVPTLGNGALRDLVLQLDARTRRVAFRRDGDEPIELQGRRGIGVAVVLRTDGAWRIVDVVPGSAGARAGLATGDRVVSFEGAPTEELELDAWARSVRTGVGFEVEVERDGRRLTLRVEP